MIRALLAALLLTGCAAHTYSPETLGDLAGKCWDGVAVVDCE